MAGIENPRIHQIKMKYESWASLRFYVIKLKIQLGATTSRKVCREIEFDANEDLKSM